MIEGEYTCYFCEEEYDELVEVVGKGKMCQDCFDREYDSKKYYQVFFQINKDNFDELSPSGGFHPALEQAKRFAKAITGGMVMELRPVFRNPVDFAEYEPESEVQQKARAFDRTIEHLDNATKDGRRREQLRAKIGKRTMLKFLKEIKDGKSKGSSEGSK